MDTWFDATSPNGISKICKGLACIENKSRCRNTENIQLKIAAASALTSSTSLYSFAFCIHSNRAKYRYSTTNSISITCAQPRYSINFGEHQYDKKCASELTSRHKLHVPRYLSTRKSRRWQLSRQTLVIHSRPHRLHYNQLHALGLLISILAPPSVLNVSFSPSPSCMRVILPSSRRLFPSLAVRLSSAQASLGTYRSNYTQHGTQGWDNSNKNTALPYQFDKPLSEIKIATSR
jgi:hypothetical protein